MDRLLVLFSILKLTFSVNIQFCNFIRGYAWLTTWKIVLYMYMTLRRCGDNGGWGDVVYLLLTISYSFYFVWHKFSGLQGSTLLFWETVWNFSDDCFINKYFYFYTLIKTALFNLKIARSYVTDFYYLYLLKHLMK